MQISLAHAAISTMFVSSMFLEPVVSFGIHAVTARQTEEIQNSSWKTVPNSFGRGVDINDFLVRGVLVRNDIVTFDTINVGDNHDVGNYNRLEHNCRTNQVRSVRHGYAVSGTRVRTKVSFVLLNHPWQSPNNISAAAGRFFCNLAQQRWGALQATKHFRRGTVGFGVHRAIKILYYGNETLSRLLGFRWGGYENKYSAQIGSFFQRSDIQGLMKQSIDSDANLRVAQKEVEYWKSVLNDPRATPNDKRGARLALKFTPEVRARLHKYYANGEYWKANLLIIRIYPPAIKP